MANSFKFYSDSALSNEITALPKISQNIDGSTGDVDGVIYYGSTASGTSVQADSDPGVDQIAVSITDTVSNEGAGPQPNDIKLASSNAGLGAAVAGDPLNIGLTIASGAVNKVEVHYRMITPDVAAAGTYNDLGFVTNATRES